MKLFLIVVTLVSSVYTEEWVPKNSEELQKINAECSRMYELGAEDVGKMEPTNDDKTQNYFLCTVEKIGMFSTDHGYDVNRFAKQFKYGDEEVQAKNSAEYCISQYYNPDGEGDKGNLEVLRCFIRKQGGLEK